MTLKGSIGDIVAVYVRWVSRLAVVIVADYGSVTTKVTYTVTTRHKGTSGCGIDHQRYPRPFHGTDSTT